MRILLIILFAVSPLFALETLWDYSDRIDSVTYPIATGRVETIPADGSYGYSRSGVVYFITHRYCTNTYPEGWYSADGANDSALYKLQGQDFMVADSIGDNWSVGFKIAGGAYCNDYRDTLVVCKDVLFDQEWVTHPIDTFYATFITPTYNQSAIFQTDGCAVELADSLSFFCLDTCAFIVYCDTAMVPCSDTLSITRTSEWPPFYQVEWFVRMVSNSDSFYYDTLRYVTVGDTIFRPLNFPVRVVGESPAGTTILRGRKSAGMDIWSDRGRLLKADLEEEVNTGYPPFSISWTGLSEGVNTLYVWGVTPEGVHTDTTKITRIYHRTNYPSWRPR